MYWILAAIVAVLVMVLLYAEFNEKRRLIYFVKPPATLTVIGIAVLPLITSQPYDTPMYVGGILIGLIFCFGGDMALMFTSKRAFIIGLVSFLIGHLMFAFTFGVYSNFAVATPVAMILVFAVSAAVFLYLRPGLNNMTIPVLVYIIAIAVMVERAAAMYSSGKAHPTQAMIVIWGVILFYISDAILAINKFRRPLKYNRISLLFYYASLVLLAVSTRTFG